MDSNFDVIVLGTGLSESITAAALSKAGFKVAHIDVNSFYGGDEASLSVEELIQWADRNSSQTEASTPFISSQQAKFSSISRSPSNVPCGRQYSLSLSPSIIPAVGPLISSLVSSGVARYGGYRLLERVGMYDSGGVKNVPGSKEDVFKDKYISLVDKRRLMRFLMFAAGEFEGSKDLEDKEDIPFFQFLQNDFSLNHELASAITYSLTYCTSASEPTLTSLQRLRRYLHSSGRYGASPFLIGHYGGSGEIAQGFCRTSAVSGGVYILGQNISSISQVTEPLTDNVPPQPPSSRSLPFRYSVELGNFPENLTCDLIISSPDHVPSEIGSSVKYIPSPSSPAKSSVARCIAIVDQPIQFSSSSSTVHELFSGPDAPATQQSRPQEPDTSVLVFPPASLSGGSDTASANVLITGEGTISAPKGKYIVYISMQLLSPTTSSAESLLKPYLDATLALTPSHSTQPLFAIFYVQNPSSSPLSSPTPSQRPNFLVTPVPTSLLPDSADSAATNAETVFWEAVSILKAVRCRRGGESIEIDSFWPLQSAEADEEVDDEW